MSNPIEDFECILKKHSSKRHIALYKDNKQLSKQTYKAQDVMSSVSEQINAIQVADARRNKSVSRDLEKFKKSTFLSISKLPVFEDASKQINTFDTQYVSNTQLINIIEDAELIDKHRGITQEFETSFSHIDKLCGLSGSTSVLPDQNNTVSKQSELETDNLVVKCHSNCCKVQCIEDNDTIDGKYGHNCANLCITGDDGTYKTDVDEKFDKNKDGIEVTGTSTPTDVENNDSIYNIIDGVHKACLDHVRIAINKDILKETTVSNDIEQNVIETGDITHKTYIKYEEIAKNKAIIEVTDQNSFKNRNLNNNIATGSEITEKDITFVNTGSNETDNFKNEEMEQGLSELNECIEIDVNTENYTERSPSPVFINKKVKNKSKSPSPLVFDLDTFEKFENFAVSMLEHDDFEKAKHVINSQILGKELHVTADEDVGLESKDILSPLLRIKTSLYNIQNTAHKNNKYGTVTQDFLTDNHLSYHFNKEVTCESLQISKARYPEDIMLNSKIENKSVDNSNVLNDPIFSSIQNQSPNLKSKLLSDNLKAKGTSRHLTNNKNITTRNNEVDTHVNPKDSKLDQSNISILNDEILFSSDEEDIHKEYQVLPFTCALETSFYNQSDVLDRSMYVGFQTASNRSIQICKDSFEKARSLLSGVDSNEATVTELVKICDDDNRDIDNTEGKNVVNGKVNKNSVQIDDRDTEIFSNYVDTDNITDQYNRYKEDEDIEDVSSKESNINRCVMNVKRGSYNHKSTVENNNNFDGFKTASNKRICLSDKALARCKKVFQDINLDEKYDTQTEIDAKDMLINANFEDKKFNDVGMNITEADFRATDIKVNFEKHNTADMVMKDECIDDLINNINDEVIIQEFENIEMSLEEDKGFEGFKTASDKNIVISNEALAKTKNIFDDIIPADGIDETTVKIDNIKYLATLTTDKTKVDTNVGLKAASTKHTQISGAAFHEPENIFQGCTDVDKLQTDKHKSLSETYRKQYNNLELIPEQRVSKIDRFNDDQSSTNSFTGFKTANNKVIKISKEALAKTENVFKDIDSVQFHEKSNINKKTAYPNIEHINQPSTSKTNFAGFTTGYNKAINVSVDTSNIKSYAKEDTIEKLNLEEFIKPSTSKASFGGFKTANNRDIKISEAALTETRHIFNDIDSVDMPRKPDTNIPNDRKGVENLKNTATKSFAGFKTANNKEIRVSEAALAKTRTIFSDIDGVDNKNVNIDASIGKDIDDMDKPEENNAPIRHVLTVNEHIFEEDTSGKEKNPEIMPKYYTFQGFKTASNKHVNISKEALSKTKHIFKDIDAEDNLNIEAEKLHIKSKNIRSSSFETATDNFVYKPKGNIPGTGSISMFKGFQTASNKVVAVSKEALARSRNIFKEFDAIENNNNTSLRNNINDFNTGNSYKIEEENEHRSEFKGFKSGNNKVINVCEKAVVDSRKLLDDSKFKQFKASYKRGISEQALKKCKIRPQDILNEDERDENVNNKINKNIDTGFKSTNNQTIKVSEDASIRQDLKNARFNKILDDKDTIDKATGINDKESFIAEDISDIIDTQVANNFEDTLYTEDFEATPIKSKRSGSPILSCPRAKRRKKFEAPYSEKPVKNTVKTDMTVKKTDIIKYDDNYKTNKRLKLTDLQQYVDGNAKIDPYLATFTYDNLLKFKFNGTRNDLPYSNTTVTLLKQLFLETVNSKLVPEGWIGNHLRLIIWKLISYEIKFPRSNIVCSATNVLNQLKYRYNRELFNAERPALRKIYERDDLSTKTIVLCVVQIYENGVQVYSVANLTSTIELLLTDGWYCIKASTDRMLAKLVYQQKIVVGTKMVTNGAELLNCEQGIAPWEDTSSVRLKLFGNSTRRARWDARLGYHGNAAILTHLSTVNIDGGRVSQLRVFVARVYPALYVEKFEDGSTVTRSERLEHLHQTKYETERQIVMEKLYEEVEKEFSDQESQDSEGYSNSSGKRTCLDSGTQIAKIMRKSNDPAEFRAQLTSSQSILLAHYTEKRREKLLQDVQARIREKIVKNGMCVARNVVPVKKIRVVGVEERGDTVKVTKGMMSIWKPNEAVLELVKEGAWVDILNVVPTAVRYSEIQLSAGRQSVFSQSKYTEPDTVKPYTTLLKRKCYYIKDLAHNPTMSTDYNEIDTVGLVFLIDPSFREFESTKRLFQNVYITDGDKNIICVNFWGGLKKFGFENLLDTGQIVVCGNLQKRAGNTRNNIPQYRVTEFSYFTKTPKNENARIILEELNKIFLSLDRRKFCDDCIVLKNNYSVLKNYNNENVSPYRPNNSDLNISKNKQFINCPLVIKDNFNLTGLDFESTFKHTDTQDLSKEVLLRKKRVNDKITKLKMYGEPPPLSHITILNKSKNAFSSYKSPLPSDSSGSNATRVPNSKFDSSTNVASTKSTPQKVVVLNDGGHSPVLDRTYVKNVNPVKLNFENNDSVIDHFADEFDGSPPLSLD